jgi:hypothetical protein
MTIEAQRPIGQTGLPEAAGTSDSRRREMTTFLQAGIGCCAALLLTAMLTVPAEARIQCRGNFQMTKYGPIATPYCEEEQIAFVARSYGQSVTGAQVRKNPLMKVYLCQTLGYDSRLKGSCAGYGPDSYAPAR